MAKMTYSVKVSERELFNHVLFEYLLPYRLLKNGSPRNRIKNIKRIGKEYRKWAKKEGRGL